MFDFDFKEDLYINLYVIVHPCTSTLNELKLTIQELPEFIIAQSKLVVVLSKSWLNVYYSLEFTNFLTL